MLHCEAAAGITSLLMSLTERDSVRHCDLLIQPPVSTGRIQILVLTNCPGNWY